MKRLHACANCGSDRLRLPSLGDGVMVGMAQDLRLSACDACGSVGVALEFDDEAARAAFERSRRKTRTKG